VVRDPRADLGSPLQCLSWDPASCETVRGNKLSSAPWMSHEPERTPRKAERGQPPLQMISGDSSHATGTRSSTPRALHQRKGRDDRRRCGRGVAYADGKGGRRGITRPQPPLSRTGSRPARGDPRADVQGGRGVRLQDDDEGLQREDNAPLAWRRSSRRFLDPCPKAGRIEDPAEWTEAKIVERAKTLAATRAPRGIFGRLGADRDERTPEGRASNRRVEFVKF